MLERRAMLAGLAALPVAGLPTKGPAAIRPDRFAALDAEIIAVDAATWTVTNPADVDRLLARHTEIDEAVFEIRPETLAEAASLLAFARRDFIEFALDGDPESGDRANQLTLHAIDGAIAVLRQATGGGVA